MCKFIGKSNERVLWKLSKSAILRLYSIVHVTMETMKTSQLACQSKSFISIFFTCQVSAYELQPFSCHDSANEIYSQTTKTVFSHLNSPLIFFPKNSHVPSQYDYTKVFWKQKMLIFFARGPIRFTNLRPFSWEVRKVQTVLTFSTVAWLNLEFNWSVCIKKNEVPRFE